MDTKKLLILTLGAGSLLGRDSEDVENRREAIVNKVRNNEYPYQMTEYSLEKGGVTKAFSDWFVAKPLIETFQPDEIVIIGTVKSQWASFLMRFHKELGESALVDILNEIDRIEMNNGLETNGALLDRYQRELSSMFSANLDPFLFPKVKVVLTRYGINEAQLEENYDRIKDALAETLDKTLHYEVAFDITLSFRSMPIYNLTVLNYLRYVEGYDINISDVYYGNLEVKGENNNIAPLTDLSPITDILDLTNGVSEFRMTGSTQSLRQALKGNKRMQELLLHFDLALALNDFEGIYSAVSDLTEYFSNVSNVGEYKEIHRGDLSNSEPVSMSSGVPFRDAETMLRVAIERDILRGNQLQSFRNIETDYRAQRDLKYLLGCWLLDQKRYGQAALVGLEALRSILVPYLLKSQGKKVNAANCNNENNRQVAIAKLEQSVEKTKALRKKAEGVIENEDENRVFMVLDRMNSAMEEARAIRNTYAHILGFDPKREISSSNKAAEAITEFYDALYALNEVLQDDESTFMTLYSRKNKTRKSNKSKNKPTLIISFLYNQEDDVDKIDEWIVLYARKRKEATYILPQNIRKKLGKMVAKPNKNAVSAGIFLKEYIAKYFDIYSDENVTNVIFDDTIRTEARLLMTLAASNPDSNITFFSNKDGSIAVANPGKTGLVLDEGAEDEARSNINDYDFMLDDEPVELDVSAIIAQSDGKSVEENQSDIDNGSVKAQPDKENCQDIKMTPDYEQFTDQKKDKKRIGILITSLGGKNTKLTGKKSFVSAYRDSGVDEIILMPSSERELFINALEHKDEDSIKYICASIARYMVELEGCSAEYLFLDNSIDKKHTEEIKSIFTAFGFSIGYSMNNNGTWKGELIHGATKKILLKNENILEKLKGKPTPIVKRNVE